MQTTQRTHRRLATVLTASSLAIAACGGDTAASAYTLGRTSQGIAEIAAPSYEGLGQGLGFAYAQDNYCLLQDMLLTVNGERSQWLGPDASVGVETEHRSISNLESDFFYRYYVDGARADALYANADATTLALIRGYVRGVNQYASQNGTNSGDARCQGKPWLRAMTETDARKILVDKAILASGSNFIQAFEAATPPQAGASVAAATPTAQRADWRLPLTVPPMPLASNGWAFGRDRTGSGRAMLFGNPHFPWESGNRFYQMHLTIPGELDVTGAALGGFPFVQIGYNRQFAWSHTTATGKRFTLHELKLVPGKPTQYLMDGAVKEMTQTDISVPVATPQGTAMRTRRFYASELGPLLVLPSAGLNWTSDRAYAFADVNLGNNRMLSGWTALAKASSVREARSALATTLGIPWVNTIAADATGEVLYADVTPIPNIDATDIARCKPSAGAAALLSAAGLVVLDGSRSDCRWRTEPGTPAPGLTPPERLAATVRTDFVANSNDSYWLVNPAQTWPAMSPMLGPVAVTQRPRTRAAQDLFAHRFAGDDGLPGKLMDAESLKALWFDSRNFAASQVLDNLLAICPPGTHVALPDNSDVALDAACSALRQWDRKDGIHARGAHVFREFWKTASALPNVYAVPFDANDPVHTPRGLNVADAATRQKLLQALGAAVKLFAAAGVPLDAELGTLQYVLTTDSQVPVAGGDEYEGVLNKLELRAFDGKRYTPFYGTSYVQLVVLDNAGATAEGLLVYGQSSNPASPYAQVQMKAYSEGRMLALPSMR